LLLQAGITERTRLSQRLCSTYDLFLIWHSFIRVLHAVPVLLHDLLLLIKLLCQTDQMACAIWTKNQYVTCLLTLPFRKDVTEGERP
jgi:hypothetical protein